MFELDPGSTAPIYIHIYERFRDLIHDGRMGAGQRAPSLRTLASELGVSRGTVEAAYDRLIGESYLVARGAAGTFVAERGAAQQPPTRNLTGANARADPVVDPLRLGVPALDEFPRRLWSKLVARRSRESGSLTMPDPCGYFPLRQALATYLLRARGVSCAPAQIFILPAYTAALSVATEVLLKPGDGVWIENPGFPPTARVLEKAGARLNLVPVDGDGIEVEFGERHYSSAKLAVVTPSHQSPLGVSLSLARRRALLRWAEAADSWIFEDDYDGEFRYSGHPLPALKSLGAGSRVIYAGSLSKVLFPGLRLSYLVVPQTMISAFEAACDGAVHGGCPQFMQGVVTDFIEHGHFASHVRRMRSLYALRRGYLADALADLEPFGLTVRLQQGGMHLLALLDGGASDQVLAEKARNAGLGLSPLSHWTRGERGQQGLLMGFTNVSSVENAVDLVNQLSAAWGAAAVRLDLEAGESS